MKLLAWTYIPEKFYDKLQPWIDVCNNKGTGIARCDIGPNELITILVPNVLMLAGVIFFIMILVGGWGVISSAGEEQSAQDKAKAKAALTYGAAGFLLIISAFFILQVVKFITGVDFINSPI